MHYDSLKGLALADQVEALTRYLVGISSINGTDGERQIAEAILRLIQSFPYFRVHPMHVWVQPLDHDGLDRHNVFALVRGADGARNTIIYHAHLDTVGVEDYGALKSMALHPDALCVHFRGASHLPHVQADALSGDWLFGRGALDMKSGIAVHLANLLYFSENPSKLSGNLLVMFNPVEENQHTGIIAAVHELLYIQQQLDLDYVFAVNDDFTSPLYPGDNTRYIYTGAVGKLLPCFYIQGRQAHVGETLTGVDPTLIASEINLRMNNHLDFAEELPGEVVMPPSCLYQRDTKDFYNVQTAGQSWMYFNYFLYQSSVQDVLGAILRVAEEACRSVSNRLSDAYQTMMEQSGIPAKSEFSWDAQVCTFADLVSDLEAKGIPTKTILQEVVVRCSGEEPRTIGFRMVEALLQSHPVPRPRVVVFFAPPYCPHNELTPGNPLHDTCLAALDEAIQHCSETTAETFEVKRFFPYLSDSSYLSLMETMDELSALVDNFPGWTTIYPVPLTAIQSLQIPCINVGVYGKDAHQWTERVYKPYSFDVLPKFIRHMTQSLLRQIS